MPFGIHLAREGGNPTVCYHGAWCDWRLCCSCGNLYSVCAVSFKLGVLIRMGFQLQLTKCAVGSPCTPTISTRGAAA
eukprot:1392681-Prymnesium_polylepis.2